jgi:hypothetical protein
MSLTIRRVVTGHDENGRAIVSIDETSKNVVQTRSGAITGHELRSTRAL